MNDFIKSKRLYMLIVLPFLVVAMAFISGNLSTVMEGAYMNGGIHLTSMSRWANFWLSVGCSSLVVLGGAYMIFITNERFKLLHQTTTLPSLIYVLLTSGVVMKLGVSNLFIAVLVLAIAIDRFQVAINNIKSNKALFDFGFFVALSVAIYPKFILLILWALCVSFFSGRSTLKDLLALLYGLLVPAIFMYFYYFWTDSLGKGYEIFVCNLCLGSPVAELPTIEWMRLGILSLILFVSLYQILMKFSILVVNRRRGLLTSISLLVFLIVSLLLIPGDYYDFIYVIALPLSVIYAHFFLSNRSVIFGKIMFVLLLIVCFISCLI